MTARKRIQADGLLSPPSALDIATETLPHLDETDFRHLTTTAEQNAGKVLRDLVARAHGQGIEAKDKLALGRPWLEIVRQVLRDQHDLLLIGTRDRTGLRRMLFGGTAVSLVRRCPCPVWVAKPEPEPTYWKLRCAAAGTADLDQLLTQCREGQPLSGFGRASLPSHRRLGLITPDSPD